MHQHKAFSWKTKTAESTTLKEEMADPGLDQLRTIEEQPQVKTEKISPTISNTDVFSILLMLLLAGMTIFISLHDRAIPGIIVENLKSILVLPFFYLLPYTWFDDLEVRLQNCKWKLRTKDARQHQFGFLENGLVTTIILCVFAMTIAYAIIISRDPTIQHMFNTMRFNGWMLDAASCATLTYLYSISTANFLLLNKQYSFLAALCKSSKNQFPRKQWLLFLSLLPIASLAVPFCNTIYFHVANSHTLLLSLKMPDPALMLSVSALNWLICFQLKQMLVFKQPRIYSRRRGDYDNQQASDHPHNLQIDYNHFAELTRASQRRKTLHKRWKLVLFFVLLLAVPCLQPLLSAAMLSHIFTLHKTALTIYPITGTIIFTVIKAMISVMLLGLGAGMVAYLFAPKRITVTEEGLLTSYSPITQIEPILHRWEKMKSIQIKRPINALSAAGSRMVFDFDDGSNVFLKLDGFAEVAERDRLLQAIERWAPEIKRDYSVELALRAPAANYTDIWLQALAAPPHRERFEPLIADVLLKEGRYRVEGLLGSGGQGFAYLAKDKTTQNSVVLKEFMLPIFVDVGIRRKALDSFEKEAYLLSTLDHPQIVKLEGFFIEDHRAYLVLEHIDGDNLRLIVSKNGPLPEEQIRNLAEQMTTILQYLHALTPPLVHRDFTPDNLILRKDGTLKLIDFNVAQQVEYATTGTVVGKQAYLPPEQFRGQAVPASDLYALGATLYFLASGKDPVPISVARPIEDGIAISAELDELIAGLTQIEVKNRPTLEIVTAVINQRAT